VPPLARAALSTVSLALHRLTRLGGSGNTARILYYHSVSDDPVRSSVSPAVFAAQMEFLRARYQVLGLSDVVQRLARREPLPARAVVITLDDGFRDNYEQAFPILARAGVTATVFLTASYIGTEQLPTLTRTDFVPRPLDWVQVKEMRAHGIDFGSHTMTHPMLCQLPLADAHREIAESRRVIEDRLGAPVSLFCYPRGDFNDAVKGLVQQEGYVAACTTLPGTNGWRTDRFALRRTYISRRDTAGEFARKVAGAYDLLQHAMRAWRHVRPR
jgi:peptidoglycan/xylan/chitin deacetylase (PgdA/CDA1 family)